MTKANKNTFAAGKLETNCDPFVLLLRRCHHFKLFDILLSFIVFEHDVERVLKPAVMFLMLSLIFDHIIFLLFYHYWKH